MLLKGTIYMQYRICNRCVMDTSDPKIKFDENGFCNHCNDALKKKEIELFVGKVGEQKFANIIKILKDSGKGKKYDCVLGISGGIDSSYLAYILRKENIRILGVHIDAGWNTAVSTRNVKRIAEKCNIDLKIIKINHDEMMDLQRAYFLSEVINQDVPQDHAFFAKLYEFTVENGLEYFISGHNWVSESITPLSWGYDAYDSKNLRDIHKKYGKVKLNEFPTISFYENNIKYPYIKKLKKLRPLNCIDYNPQKALEILKKEIGFEDYGKKHCESVFTRLYQAYIQPQKFGFDKRRAHLSSLIISGEITRNEALKELETQVCSEDQIEADINYFIKNINISREEFDRIINHHGARSHLEFKNDKNLIRYKNSIRKLLKK